jgi:hypothetical protein
MAWMNYREIQDRFAHIDAEFVQSDISFAPQRSHASVTVRFYPWWEHPGYLEARETGSSWGFTDAIEAGRQHVTVKAVVPHAARISQRDEVTDWVFSEEHPLLWDFAEEVTIYVNGHFDVLHLTERVLEREMPFVTRRDLERYFDPTWQPLPSRGILIPAQLYSHTLESLAEMNVTVLPCEAPPIPGLTVLLLDEDDYIVAEDFAVDVPEFAHHPGWFRPSAPNVAG